jgi:hypothetical protein
MSKEDKGEIYTDSTGRLVFGSHSQTQTIGEGAGKTSYTVFDRSIAAGMVDGKPTVVIGVNLTAGEEGKQFAITNKADVAKILAQLGTKDSAALNYTIDDIMDDHQLNGSAEGIGKSKSTQIR